MINRPIVSNNVEDTPTLLVVEDVDAGIVEAVVLNGTTPVILCAITFSSRLNVYVISAEPYCL